MASQTRPRYESECSNSSTDSSLLDGSSGKYATVAMDVLDYCYSDQSLLPGSQAKGKVKGRDSKCNIAIISLVLSVVSFVVVVGGACVCYFMLQGGLNGGFGVSSTLENEKVCMPCAEVSPSPLEEFESPILQQLEVDVGDDGEKTCCAKTPAQYAALFKLILKRQEAVKKLADILGSSGSDVKADGGKGQVPVRDYVGGNAISAHLITKPVAPDLIDSDGTATQHWKSPEESPISHVREPGLKFYENKIYVQSAGLYFVYCQILYNRADDDAEPHPAIASNYVRRYSYAYPSSSTILLKARHTRNSGANDRHSSWVGGLFFLHAGDYLYVQVSVPQLVSHDDIGSFFGLFKVGN